MRAGQYVFEGRSGLNGRGARSKAAALAATTCLVSVGVAASAWAQTTPPKPADGATAVSEVIVTAQRREERLSKVPISIAAYTGQQLREEGAENMSDLSHLTPGFNVTPGATVGGGDNVSIRGISTTQGAATIGIYIDDTPIQSRANNWTQPRDPSLFDMQRVEVLRGPQGTLYGASSEGGTLRFITTAPSLTTFSGQAVSEISGNERGGLGYEEGVAVGGPLIKDVLGFRASIDLRQDPGYVDQVSPTTRATLNSNINDQQDFSARLALKYQPIANLTIEPSVNFQRLHGDDEGLIWTGSVVPNLGKYQSEDRILTPSTDKSVIGALKITYDFGGATLTSVTSGVNRDLTRTDDYTAAVGVQIAGTHLPAFLAADPSFVSPQYTHTTQHNFSQEVRLSTPDNGLPVYGTVGVFYATSTQNLTQVDWTDSVSTFPAGLYNPSVYLLPGGLLIQPARPFDAYIPQGPFPAGGIIADKFQSEYDEQTAAFVDLTWKVTDKLRLDGGVRVAREGYSFQYITNGWLQAGQNILPKTSINTTAINPKFTASYQITDGDMVYFSAAKGQRPGGANRPIPLTRCAADIAATGSIPQTYQDDEVWSYEVGSKVRTLQNRLQLDGSVFYLDWQNVQQTLTLTNCSTSYVGNFGSATSKGFDMHALYLLAQGLSVSGNVGYTDSTLAQSVLGTVNATTHVAPVLAVAGSPLALVPNWTGDLALAWDNPLPWGRLNGFARLDYQYQGEYKRTPSPGSVLYNPITYNGDAYDILNFRFGVHSGAWRWTVFANNLTDSYPTLYKSAAAGNAGFVNLISTLPPRTFGANLAYRW